VYEFDLLVTDWKEYITRVYKLGAKRIIVHVDKFTYDDYEELFFIAHEYNLTLGLTVSNDVSVDLLIYSARKLEESRFFVDHSKVFVQVTGIRSLVDGQRPFDERVISRIRILKKLFPLLIVQVSGRINPATAKLVKYAGADRMVVGSYIFGHEDTGEAIENLIKALREEMPSPEKEAQKEVVSTEEKVVTPPLEKKEEIKNTPVSTKRLARLLFARSFIAIVNIIVDNLCQAIS
jgi:pentose-5-phosphate-3-epimerase